MHLAIGGLIPTRSLYSIISSLNICIEFCFSLYILYVRMPQHLRKCKTNIVPGLSSDSAYSAHLFPATNVARQPIILDPEYPVRAQVFDIVHVGPRLLQVYHKHASSRIFYPHIYLLLCFHKIYNIFVTSRISIH